jgi:hypothetical protein
MSGLAANTSLRRQMTTWRQAAGQNKWPPNGTIVVFGDVEDNPSRVISSSSSIWWESLVLSS